MITTKYGETRISGSAVEIVTDLEVVIRGVKRAFEQAGIPKELAEQMISNAVRSADMTPEEKVSDLLNIISKKLDEILN